MPMLRGFLAITFRCPSCAGDTFGYENDTGHCRRVGFETAGDCRFSWPRRHDWRVFVRVADGSGFRSAAELQAFLTERDEQSLGAIGRAAAAPRETFAQMLQNLLTELMEQPPTLAVVQGWTREQNRLALHWCSRELAYPWDGGGVREPRPAFIEAGAATA